MLFNRSKRTADSNLIKKSKFLIFVWPKYASEGIMNINHENGC